MKSQDDKLNEKQRQSLTQIKKWVKNDFQTMQDITTREVENLMMFFTPKLSAYQLEFERLQKQIKQNEKALLLKKARDEHNKKDTPQN